MAKVDWITWKTDISEIINPDKILENLNDLFNDYKCYMNSVVYEELNHEVTVGGLDKYSLNIVGTSPANETALNILNRIDDIKTTIENLKNKVYNSAVEQKNIEKQQLINCIEEKILEEEKILSNTVSLRERISTNTEIVDINTVNDIIEITNEKINKLKERLELAKSI